MDYTKQIKGLTLKLEEGETRLAQLEEHLKGHPSDYQARIKSITLNSDNIKLSSRLKRLSLLAEIEKYK